jgi:hypothetical protein
MYFYHYSGPLREGKSVHRAAVGQLLSQIHVAISTEQERKCYEEFVSYATQHNLAKVGKSHLL